MSGLRIVIDDRDLLSRREVPARRVESRPGSFGQFEPNDKWTVCRLPSRYAICGPHVGRA